ncbi:MAG: hypothetical protein M1370_03145 [Bacteroidetes bacterium]|nr:hypothetical protein [Bacteroidota bacterium]
MRVDGTFGEHSPEGNLAGYRRRGGDPDIDGSAARLDEEWILTRRFRGNRGDGGSHRAADANAGALGDVDSRPRNLGPHRSGNVDRAASGYVYAGPERDRCFSSRANCDAHAHPGAGPNGDADGRPHRDAGRHTSAR